MMSLVRNIAILLAVLVIAMVLATAGEGACAECVQGCCARNDSVRRLIAAIRRVLRRLTSLFEAVTQAVFTPPLGFLDHAASSIPCALQVAPLRI